jgi:prevent-host-death family protein
MELCAQADFACLSMYTCDTFVHIKRIAVRDLRSRLAEMLSLVEEGERIAVTRRGRVVAELVPVGPADPTEKRLASLAARGVLRRRRRDTSPLGADFKGFPQLAGQDLAVQVIRDRR